MKFFKNSSYPTSNLFSFPISILTENLILFDFLIYSFILFQLLQTHGKI